MSAVTKLHQMMGVSASRCCSSVTTARPQWAERSVAVNPDYGGGHAYVTAAAARLGDRRMRRPRSPSETLLPKHRIQIRDDSKATPTSRATAQAWSHSTMACAAPAWPNRLRNSPDCNGLKTERRGLLTRHTRRPRSRNGRDPVLAPPLLNDRIFEPLHFVASKDRVVALGRERFRGRCSLTVCP
jgi:hypothetical protein